MTSQMPPYDPNNPQGYQYPPVPPRGYNQNQAPSNGTATTSLILGILSLLCFGFLTGIPAIFVGISGKKKAEKMGGEGRTMAQWGIISGIVGSILSIILSVFLIFQFFIAVEKTKEGFNSVKKEIKQSIEEYEDQQARNLKEANPDHYLIIEEQVIIDAFGEWEYSAVFENKADFRSAYTVEILCNSAEGKVLTEDGLVETLDAGNRTDLVIKLDFGEPVTNVTCSVNQVVYAVYP
jgi:hypothetical protein